MNRRRKLSLLSILLLSLAAFLGGAAAEAVPPTGCFVEHDVCPEGWIDCCCGTTQFCTTQPRECQQACGYIP